MSDQPSRILVVDDDFATRLLASEALLAAGFAPLEAEDGREALDQYDRTSPDAVLLDIHMPGLDGYEVCRRIRMRPGGVGTSILVMTATDDVDAVQRAFAAGATDFLTKPLNLPLLSHRVRYMLRAAATAAAARDDAARLARAQRLARLVHWQLGDDDQLTWASDPLAVFWPEAPADHAREHLVRYVHPDDRARVAAVLASRAPHQLDFRLVFPDGSERFVHQDAELDITDRGVVLIGATQDVTAIKHAERQIAQLAFYDDVTGIPNRQLVERYLRRADPGAPRSAIAIDLGTGELDRLSVVARDAVIRAATARVIERVRGADLEVRLDQVARPIEAFTGATLVARTGPDELIVITSELASGSAATALHLAEALGQPFAIDGRELVLRPRLGAADYPDPAGELRRLDDHARAAMYEAERIAPRNVRVLTAAARELQLRRAELAAALELALHATGRGGPTDLVVDYVPRVEPASRAVVGVRARPRWRPAERDPQALPAILAGNPALADRLARWTLDRACRDAARWLAGGLALRLAVELPAARVAAPDFASDLARVVADARFEPLLLDLELAGPLAGDDELERLAAAATAVRALGARVALAHVDDRCSLRELRRLPLDGLAVDRATIDRIGPSLVATLAGLARGLELRLAVTDVDAPAALAALDPHEPDELAGALFGAAVTADQVSELVHAPAITQRDLPRMPAIDATAAE
ncbi:MAG TPA: response regulator [Kofleriaceae bacterium]|jgi:PleD family two-component response regulator/EAL domain-containing protein (putative c-di-GMP-specific phosphodiesterase class I)|nr:response regulator [Kofleriaceae bacterium]